MVLWSIDLSWTIELVALCLPFYAAQQSAAQHIASSALIFHTHLPIAGIASRRALEVSETAWYASAMFRPPHKRTNSMAVFSCYCRQFSGAKYLLPCYCGLMQRAALPLLLEHTSWSVLVNYRFYSARKLHWYFMLWFRCGFAPLSIYSESKNHAERMLLFATFVTMMDKLDTICNSKITHGALIILWTVWVTIIVQPDLLLTGAVACMLTHFQSSIVNSSIVGSGTKFVNVW